MTANRLGLSILWHQHQPFYKNNSGVYQMPWVRMHGIKDYVDLLLVLKEFPNIKQNFNLVPSLLFQIQDYVKNGVKDNIWELTEIPADKLSFGDKKKILDKFFQANLNMIKPYPRYYELYQEQMVHLKFAPVEEKIASFGENDYRDLQVWFNLAWVGQESRKRSSIAKLFKKEQFFSEEDKFILLGEHIKIMEEVIPFHKKMWEKGQIELSTSPFYHPILPLLCDNSEGKVSCSNINLPMHHFSHPEDAEAQIQKALEYFEDIFGRKPNGLWPSEGGVSQKMLEIVARLGIKWVATDEGILANTLRKDFSHSKIYQTYTFETQSGDIFLFFRDHYLSDAIGFVYSNWPMQQAINDFVSRLHSIRKMLIEKYGEDSLKHFVVPVILDGENCWEYYNDDGKPFLRELYKALSQDEFVETITLSEAIKRNGTPEKLNNLHPGSWINSNFNIWIGAEEDNRSWDVLSETRAFLSGQEKLGIHSDEIIHRAWEQIYIAEGSDWNWWFGDEHSSANDIEFDLLYREHLMEVYNLLNAEVPATLYQTIKHIRTSRLVKSQPVNFIEPTIDGLLSYFYEWVGAALYEIKDATQSSMHKVTNIIDKLYVGFNYEKIFLRLDFLKVPDPLAEFIIAIKRPKQMTVVVSPLRGVMEKFEMRDEVQQKTTLMPHFRLKEIMEISISFADLDVKSGEILGFQLIMKLNGHPLEEFPRMNLIEVDVPDKVFELIEWAV